MYIGQKSGRCYIKSDSVHHKGMSTVFLVKDSQDKHAGTFFIKLSKDTEPDTLQLLQREITNHNRLGNFRIQQDGLITFKEAIQPLADGTIGFVMEWIQEGEDIRDWLQLQRKAMNQKEFILLAWRLLWRLVRLTCAFHRRGFLHNDIKPSNIFICGNHNDFQIYLLDLGIARHKSEPLPIRMGTKTFSAPECMETNVAEPLIGLDRGDESSDLYALVQTWVRSIYPNFQRALTPDDLGLPEMSSVIPIKLQQLLKPTLNPQNSRMYRGSYDFLHAITNCILFDLPQPTFIDRSAAAWGVEFIEWYKCPLSLLTLPQKIPSAVHGPTLIPQKSGIFCQYVRDVDVWVNWGTPANHSKIPTKPVKLYSQSKLRWKYAQKGAFVDIIPVDANLPAQRLEYPSDQKAVNVTVGLHRQNNQFYLSTIEASIPGYLDSISIFAYSTFKPLYQIFHTEGKIRHSHPVEQSDSLYFIWDKTTLNIIDIVAYSNYAMKSCFKDNLVQQQLPYYTELLYGQSLQFKSTDAPLLTERSLDHLHSMAIKWKHSLSSRHGDTIDAFYQLFHTKLDTIGKEHIGILLKLIHTPAFQTLPKNDWVGMFHYCSHYNIRTHSFWILYFFLRSSDVWPLYSGRAKRLTHSFSSEDRIAYINLRPNNDSAIQHMLNIGTQSPQYTLTLRYGNEQHRISLFSGDHLTVGRWSTLTPPHISLFLSPYMPTETLDINAKEEIPTTLHTHPFIKKTSENILHIQDGGLSKVCPSCGHIYDADTSKCDRHPYESLRINATSDHTIQMERLPDYNGVLCTVSSRGVDTKTALNAFMVGSNTIVYIANEHLKLLSYETVRLELKTGTAILEPNIEHTIPTDTLSVNVNGFVLLVQ